MPDAPLGIRTQELDVAEAAAWSNGALSRPLAFAAELSVFTLCGDAVVLGDFQRRSELEATESRDVFRRGSGGTALHAGPGVLWMQLSLARPDALVACDVSRVLNRYVRPLLEAITRSSVLANYFDRDWIAVKHRPAAFIGFAHERTTGRTLVESLVAVKSPVFMGSHASLRGKVPYTLEEASGKSVENARLSERIVSAYLEAFSRPRADLEPARPGSASLVSAEPPWAAAREEAMGRVYAGRDSAGAMRVGGELMASRDAVAALEARVGIGGQAASSEDVGRAVDETLAEGGAALFGVRSLTSLRDAILDAS